MTAIEAALRIADELVAAAVPARAGLTWQGTVVVGADGDKPVTGHGDVGPTLYDGTAGIALALAAASRARPGDRALGAAAVGAATHAVTAEAAGPGLFDGTAGAALAAATVGELSRRRRLGRRSRERGGRARARLRDPRGIDGVDLISGIAGVALALLAVRGAARAARRGRPAGVDSCGRRACRPRRTPDVRPRVDRQIFLCFRQLRIAPQKPGKALAANETGITRLFNRWRRAV